MRATVIAIFLALTIGTPVLGTAAEFEFEFGGSPSVKVVISEGTAQSSPVSKVEATEHRVVVVRDGEKYLWHTRWNTPLSKSISGSYITYTALDGSGYIQVLSPEMRKLREQLPPEQRQNQFVYVEHLLYQLRSVTYFGM